MRRAGRLAEMRLQVSLLLNSENISRRFGAVTAVDQIDLGIEEGSFFAMLSPSGSGKTTCLRLISGFDRPSDGRIRIFGEDSNDIPPNRRPVNTVFQDYALFPHLDVNENVAYGLMVRGAPKAERIREAAAMLDLVKLGGYGKRKPSQLSEVSARGCPGTRTHQPAARPAARRAARGPRSQAA